MIGDPQHTIPDGSPDPDRTGLGLPTHQKNSGCVLVHVGRNKPRLHVILSDSEGSGGA
jgi:hypothetical protein